MVSISQFLLAALAIVRILAYPNGPLKPNGPPSKRSGTPTEDGMDDAGLYYSFWTAGGGGDVSYDHTKTSEFSVTWTDAADFVCGKGWKVGSSRAVSYSADIDTGENCFLAVYSMTRNPTIEYYIVDNHGTKNGWSKSEHKGTFTSDGGTYDIYTDSPIDNNSKKPGATFRQFWSVRSSPRTSGTINTAAHFDAWAKVGMVVDPSHGSQIMAIEAYRSTGSSKVVVSEGHVDLSTPPTLPSPGLSTPSSSSSPGLSSPSSSSSPGLSSPSSLSSSGLSSPSSLSPLDSSTLPTGSPTSQTPMSQTSTPNFVPTDVAPFDGCGGTQELR